MIILESKISGNVDTNGNMLSVICCNCDDSSDLPDTETNKIDEGSFAICADGKVYVTDSSRTWQQFA